MDAEIEHTRHFIHRLYFTSRNCHNIIGHIASEGPIHRVFKFAYDFDVIEAMSRLLHSMENSNLFLCLNPSNTLKPNTYIRSLFASAWSRHGHSSCYTATGETDTKPAFLNTPTFPVFSPPTYFNPVFILRFYLSFIFILLLSTVLLFTNLPRNAYRHLH